MSTNESASQNQSPAEPFEITLPGEAKTLRDRALWAGLLALITIVTYMPATNGQFIWDDERHVSQNKHLTLGREGLVNIWTKFGLKEGGTPQYYPLTHTSFWLEYQLWKLEPRWYHVTNIVIQAISAILLWTILRKLKVPGAWLAAAIFAVHPIQVESVAWISERKNLLATVLYFGALLAFLESRFGDQPSDWPSENLKPRWGFYVLSFVLFCGAMLSKTIACSMPAVMILILLWKNHRISVKQLALLVPFFAVGLGLGLKTAELEKTSVGAFGPEWDVLKFPDRTLIAGRALWFYMQKIFWPTDQAFIYPRWEIPGAPFWWWIFPVGFLWLVGVLAINRRQVGWGPLVLVLIYAGVLFPALGFFNVYPMKFSFVADHFQYPGGTAIFILTVAVAASLLDRSTQNLGAGKRATVMVCVSVPLLIVLATMSWSRAHIFKDRETLWADTVAKNPNSGMAHATYGTALMDNAFLNRKIGQAEGNPELIDAANKKLERAMGEFKTALSIRPDQAPPLANIGLILMETGQVEKSLPYFAQAIELRPDFIEGHRNYARAFITLKRYDEAIGILDKLKKITPNSPTLFSIYANAYEGKGDLDSAIAMDRESLKVRKDTAETHFHLATLLHKAKKPDEAIAELRETVTLQPDHAPAYALRGYIAIEQQDYRLAAQVFRQALEIDPRDQSALNGVRLLLSLQPATRPATEPSPVPATNESKNPEQPAPSPFAPATP